MAPTDPQLRPYRRGRLGVVCLALLLALGGCGGGGGGSSGTSSPSYTVGGTVSGLTGSGLVLQDSAGGTFSVSGNGSFAFATALASGDSYAVTVMTQPSNQTCIVNNGNGTATLTGTPKKNTQGTYTVIITASNGAAPTAMQSFTISIGV